MATKYKKVTHCVFDMDGLLLDTEPIYEEVTRQIATSVGRKFPQEVRLRMLGVTEQVSAQTAVAGCEMPITVEEYTARYKKLCYQMLPQSPLCKGAKRLLCYLHANKIPFCLATSSGEEMVNVKTTHHKELFKLFSHLVCGSTDPEVKQGKPWPDIFLVAASRFPDNPDPANCLVFEDAPNGVQAAHSAGMQSIMVPDERVPKEMCSLATVVLKSLEDFKPEEFGLPPFCD